MDERSLESMAREVSALRSAASVWGGGRTINDVLIDAEAVLEARAYGPDDHRQKYPVKPHLLYRTWRKETEADEERRGALYNGDPECIHEVRGGDGGSGVQCRRCNGWFCY